MASTVEQIKDRLNILDVVGTYVKLSKAGKDYKGISPFTKEKTPSFFVSPDRGVYYCFSTNKGGDMFTFVQELEGVDFKGALRILAERAGVEIVHEKPGEKDARERLYAALEEATKFYANTLQKDAESLAYLKRRGFDSDTIHSFRLGYAPTPEKGGWRPLTTHLEKLGYTRQELLEAGLAKLGKQNDLYDQFRSRIVFPLTDVASRVIGFSGRVFPDDPEKKAPKYLNSPDTALFHKSKFLYGYDKARAGIRKYNFTILVEGQMDIVLSHQAGFTNTVAVSGTALSADHVTLIKRLSNNLLLAFDSDPAGVRAGMRSAALALAAGMDVKVAEMPLGKDPADVVKEDPVLLKTAVREARHIIPFALNVYRKGTKDERQYAAAVRRDILPLVRMIDNAIDRAHFVRVISEHLRVPEEAIREELHKVAAPERAKDVGQGEAPRPPQHRRTGRERLIRAIAGQLLLLEEKGATERTTEIHTEFTRFAGEIHYEHFLGLVKNEREALLFEAEQLDDDATVTLLLRRVEKEFVKEALETSTRTLRDAEIAGDSAAIERALSECETHTRRLAELDKT